MAAGLPDLTRLFGPGAPPLPPIQLSSPTRVNPVAYVDVPATQSAPFIVGGQGGGSSALAGQLPVIALVAFAAVLAMRRA